MFNQSGITKTTFAKTTQILFDPNSQVSIGVIVDDAAYVTEDSKKLVKAGTPLYGDLTSRGSAFVKASTAAAKIGATVGETPVDVNANQSNAVGILLHDVDVTSGNANGTLLISGFVDLSKVDTTTAALITAEVITALKGKVTFVK